MDHPPAKLDNSVAAGFRLRLAAGLCALAAVTLAAGCTTLGGFGSSGSASSTQPHSIEAFWLKQVQSLPDPTSNGTPTPALVGCVYFYPDALASSASDGKPSAKSTQSIPARGTLVVELYDDSHRSEGQPPKPLERTTFPPEVLATLKQHDPNLGIGYSVGFPWATYSRDITSVHFNVRFEPADGGPALVTSSQPIKLDHGIVAKGNSASTAIKAAK